MFVLGGARNAGASSRADASAGAGADAAASAGAAAGAASTLGAAAAPASDVAPGCRVSAGADRRIRASRVRAFDGLHPSVVVTYTVLSLVFIMAAFQPVLVGIALACALLVGCLLRGWRSVVGSLAWQLPVLAVVALANPLFSPSGTTELFRLGTQGFYLESLVYGACMGAMLVTVMVQFSNASAVLTSDRVMSVMGGRLPTTALMVSMVARLVPQFVRRGREVSAVHDACSAAAPRTPAERTAAHMRIVSVIMGWGMEDSLETADAMRCRGWGSGPRTTYRRRNRMTRLDALALAAVVALAALCAVLAFAAVSQFRFYPTLSSLVLWWGYIPYALFFLLPAFSLIGGRFSWRH